MHRYGVDEVVKLLRLPRSTIRALVTAGFVKPERGPRNVLHFSFQDLIVLRTAQTLSAARVPARRITRSLKELRRQLPNEMPLSGLSIGAVGDQVVVRDGSGQRQAETGQYLLAFEGDPANGKLSVIERAPPPREEPDWYEQALALEASDSAAAAAAYRKAIAEDSERSDARLNLGRLLHESGKHGEAERVYREALDACGEEALLYFNLATVLEDQGRGADAIAAYESALRLDPALADAHYNLSLLHQASGRAQDAIRHMSKYRRLERG